MVEVYAQVTVCSLLLTDQNHEQSHLFEIKIQHWSDLGHGWKNTASVTSHVPKSTKTKPDIKPMVD